MKRRRPGTTFRLALKVRKSTSCHREANADSKGKIDCEQLNLNSTRMQCYSPRLEQPDDCIKNGDGHLPVRTLVDEEAEGDVVLLLIKDHVKRDVRTSGHPRAGRRCASPRGTRSDRALQLECAPTPNMTQVELFFMISNARPTTRRTQWSARPRTKSWVGNDCGRSLAHWNASSGRLSHRAVNGTASASASRLLQCSGVPTTSTVHR